MFFVSDLYGCKSGSTNTMRFKFYSSKKGRLKAKKKKLLHVSTTNKLRASRATYQSFVWINCLIAKPEIPSPLDHGWEMKEDKAVSIKLILSSQHPKKFWNSLYFIQKMCSWIKFLHWKCITLFIGACAKVHCKNHCEVEIAHGPDDEYCSDEDD